MNISNLPQHHQYHITVGEQYIYDHLLDCVQNEPAQQVLGRFHRLFIQAKHYDDQKVLDVLAIIISSPLAEQTFAAILNRCCHILINRWQLQLNTQHFVIELINLFDSIPCGIGRRKAKTYSSRMIQLVRDFLETDYYKQLKRLSTIVSQSQERKINLGKKQETLGNLIIRYPYLYDHCLLTADSSIEQKQTINHVKNDVERRFESQLSKFVTYQIRVAQAGREQQASQTDNSSSFVRKRIINPVENPTLLSDRDLGKTLKHFVGPVQRGYSYKDLSRTFLNHTQDSRNFQLFKDDLYEYVIESIDGKYGKHTFNKRLYEKMQGFYSNRNNEKPDEFLKVRTYSKLFNYLIVESNRNPNHLVFIDMISNMGTTITIGVLLKIVLLCSKVKPYIEKRFSILFDHYESFSSEGAGWLVRSLEKVHIAFSVNFGNLDMSYLQRIYRKR